MAQLKTTTATALEKLYNVDRRIIGEWAKNESKINDATHKRSTLNYPQKSPFPFSQNAIFLLS